MEAQHGGAATVIIALINTLILALAFRSCNSPSLVLIWRISSVRYCQSVADDTQALWDANLGIRPGAIVRIVILENKLELSKEYSRDIFNNNL